RAARHSRPVGKFVCDLAGDEPHDRARETAARRARHFAPAGAFRLSVARLLPRERDPARRRAAQGAGEGESDGALVAAVARMERSGMRDSAPGFRAARSIRATYAAP